MTVKLVTRVPCKKCNGAKTRRIISHQQELQVGCDFCNVKGFQVIAVSCVSCMYWRPYYDKPTSGLCDRAMTKGALFIGLADANTAGDVETEAEFGCLQWEKADATNP